MEPGRVGYRFRPKIVFLIKLLQFKAAGGGDISGCTEYPGDVCYLNMYGPGKEPWNLFSGEHEIWELHDANKKMMKEKYVVTDLTKLGLKNVSRTAGAGSWDDQSTAKPIVYDGHEMGYWRTLTYEYWGDDGEAADKFYYYMNELHLSEYALNQVNAKNNDYVICRILKNEAKHCRTRRSKKRVTLRDFNITKKNKKKKLSPCEESQSSSSCSRVVLEELDDPQEHEEYKSEQIDYADFSGPIELPETIPVYFDPNIFGFDQEQQNATFCPDEYFVSVNGPDFFGIEQNQEQLVAESWDYPEMQGNLNCNPEPVPSYIDEDSGPELYQFVPDELDVPNLFSCDDPQLPTNICVQQQEVDSFCDADYSAPVYVPDMFGIEQNQQQLVAGLWDYPEMQRSWVPSCSNSTMPDQWSLDYPELWKFVNTEENCLEICQ